MATYQKNTWNNGDLITAEKMNNIEKQLEIVTPGATNIAQNYIAGNYKVGDYCIYNGTLYRCISAGAGVPPIGWAVTTVMAETGSNINDSVAQEFSANKIYAIGDYVVYEQKLYRCVTAIEIAGNWDATKWVRAVLADDFASLKLKMVDGKLCMEVG